MTTVDLQERVVAGLRANGVDGEPTTLEPMLGGHSGLTYKIALGEQWFVVKAVPPGQRAIGRHDMLRQARIMAALAGTDVPVPRIRATDAVEPGWFAMELVAGESLEPVLDDPALEPVLAAARMLRAAEILPRLHGVPLDRLPVDGDPLSPADELARWSCTMGAVPPELVPGAARLEALLRGAVPEAVAPVLVHGDYRLGNILSVGTEPAALIDWEIWSPGDPRVELGWFLVFADGANFPGVGREVPGLPDADELVARYAGDGPVPRDLTWFDALGRFKMAAIMGHNLRRHREGRHHDPDQEKLPATIQRLIETGTDRLG
ncbi:phosphotransferase [Pimelobacter simplex]|uniref:phosphotransferase family protein n=1 Tax=Nocardioides simplex TaxID=2045 RepID=UPI000535FB35|nr:phosphotransferase family protein [Pimelobacter simplex]MCG8154528.1 phosphotransferase [Pimelobacter simplex]GEB12576.1 aminoglycoside phosphotransferase [Pimelobacter simplex]SFM93088.1 Predicted kinase, aminoglycoside phosphotransferase (APT) family [Pimelobacter simplex]